MSDEIELRIDTISVLLGALGGFLATLWRTAPLLLSAEQAIRFTSNPWWVITAGLLVGALAVGYSAGFNEVVSFSTASVYSGLLSFVLIGAVGALSLPVVTGLADQPAASLPGDNLRVATLGVRGMVCQGCRLSIKNYLESMNGTEQVKVSLPNEQARVVYDADKLSEKELVNARVFQGTYSATLKADKVYGKT